MGNAFSYMEEHRHLQTFPSKRAMDEQVKRVRYYYADDLTPSANVVLDVIKQHGLKIWGVAWLKVEEIMRLTGLKERTVKAATSLLAKLGIITKIPTKRKTNKKNQGANVYVINADTPKCTPKNAPLEDAEKLDVSKDEQPKMERETLNFFKTLLKTKDKINEKAAKPKIEDCEIYADIPSKLKMTLKRLGNNKLANDLWKKQLQAFVITGLHEEVGGQHLQQILNDNDELLNELYTRVHNAVYGYAHGTIKDIFGYVYKVSASLFEEVAAAARAPRYTRTMYDWLNA